MKLFKKLIKSYLAFGLGMIVGSIIASIAAWSVMTVAYGNPDLEKTLKIRECLQEKMNE
jgi:F0F1-type ATP synthase membrane subunit c/vacuolar-type H+-ATPase subunit K